MTLNYIVGFFLIVLGLYCLTARYNLFKIVVGMSIIDYGINLLIVSVGATNRGTAPIYSAGEVPAGTVFVDPIPQALTLTSIVIGACVTAMALALVMKMHDRYGTIDTRKIRRLHG